MEEISTEITRTLLIKAYKVALRTGKWYKLHPVERTILFLSAKILTRIKSKVLKEIILKILGKISPNLIFRFKIIIIGLKFAKKRVKQALKLGHKKAKNWLEDLNYIWYLGVSYYSHAEYL